MCALKRNPVRHSPAVEPDSRPLPAPCASAGSLAEIECMGGILGNAYTDRADPLAGADDPAGELPPVVVSKRFADLTKKAASIAAVMPPGGNGAPDAATMQELMRTFVHRVSVLIPLGNGGLSKIGGYYGN
jgi:hypothetical protein